MLKVFKQKFLFGGKHTGGVSGIFKMWLLEWLGWIKKDTSDDADLSSLDE